MMSFSFSYDQILSMFTVMWFIILAVLWFRHEVKHTPDDWTTAKDRLYTCDHCHLSFLAKNDSQNITRCPRCNNLCFLKRKKHL